MRKSLLYIIGAAALAACSDDAESPYLDGKDKSPIAVVSNLSVNTATTRAVDKEFDAGDELIARLQTIEDVEIDGSRTINYKKTETFKINPEPAHSQYKNDPNTNQTSDLTCISSSSIDGNIYWDDYSSKDYDLREKNASDQLIRGIRLFYGYCYNSRTASETGSLAEDTGILTGWTVETDQKTKGTRTSDLLFAETQESIHYHPLPADRETLVLPYTHAMSKLTIKVVCKDGFSSDKDNFANTEVVFKNLNTTATVNAPSAKVTPSGTDDITPSETETDNKNRIYTAIFAPTVMKADQLLATITDVDGNNYDVKLTDAILNPQEGTPATTKEDAWSTQLADYSLTTVSRHAEKSYDVTNGGITKPGVHYYLEVTINKQAIEVIATITDWIPVNAEGLGEIKFENDITSKDGTIADGLKTNGFDVYLSSTAGAVPDYSLATSRFSYTAADGWTNTPAIYWPNGSDKLYFRALSNATSTTDIKNGSDVLWGTTSEDTANGYVEGAPLAPRTGQVPLTFYHTMSMITINLIDKYAESDNDDAKIVLEGATIQLTNLATTGKIDLHTGDVTADGDLKENVFTSAYYAANDPSDPAKTPQVKNYIVVPQEIGSSAEVVITLADGTVYKGLLKDCNVANQSTTYVTEWEQRKHYIYDITLAKQEILFQAHIKEWETVNTSGNATLEWD